jgi:NAD-dependent protein deacetylase/lipoamidase
VRCPALGQELVAPLDGVLVPEARAAQVEAAAVDAKPVREAGGLEVSDVRLDRQRLDPLRLQSGVAAVETVEIVDTRLLEPDEVDRMVRDRLRVRLREADSNLGRERKAFHARNLQSSAMGVAELATLIAERRRCVVLTGAGVSTESGVPDFRSPTGIWAQFDPLEYGSIQAFQADPAKVWSFYAQRFSMLTEAEPNDAHRALAELEQRGYVQTLVTQNIDLLHERAGSSDVIEVHGSIRSSRCLECGATYALAEVLALLETGDVPACTRCGAIVKPDVVFFGEVLPQAAIERAFEVAREAKLMLVVGSTLEVYPVAGLPLETLSAGGELAIVNRGPTALDGVATLKIDGSAGEALTAVARNLP